jgi:hypothetical protein
LSSTANTRKDAVGCVDSTGDGEGEMDVIGRRTTNSLPFPTTL